MGGRGRNSGSRAAGYAAEKLLDGQETLGVDELEEAEFEVEALLLPVIQVVEGAQDDLEVAG
jgi:hypothetical protein